MKSEEEIKSEVVPIIDTEITDHRNSKIWEN